MESILIVSPHPDDLEISAGLFALIAISKGWKVHQLVMTDGRHGGVDTHKFGSNKLAIQRKEESLHGASILGLSSTRFLNIEDGKLDLFKNIALNEIEEEIEQRSPFILVAPSELDTHPDHQTAADICNIVIKKYFDVILIKYCFWGDNVYNAKSLAPNFSQRRLLALQVYKSQPVESYIQRMINRGGVKEDRFFISAKSEMVFRIFNPYFFPSRYQEL